MGITAPRKGAAYDSALRPLWSSPSAKTISPSLGGVSHRLAGSASKSLPNILYDTKRLRQAGTFYSLPKVERYKEPGGTFGMSGTSFGPHSNGSMRPRFPNQRDLTRNAFLARACAALDP